MDDKKVLEYRYDLGLKESNTLKIGLGHDLSFLFLFLTEGVRV